MMALWNSVTRGLDKLGLGKSAQKQPELTQFLSTLGRRPKEAA
jgi:hypothetical protein